MDGHSAFFKAASLVYSMHMITRDFLKLSRLVCLEIVEVSGFQYTKELASCDSMLICRVGRLHGKERVLKCEWQLRG